MWVQAEKSFTSANIGKRHLLSNADQADIGRRHLLNKADEADIGRRHLLSEDFEVCCQSLSIIAEFLLPWPQSV